MKKAILWDIGGVLGTNCPRLFITDFSVKQDIDVKEVVRAFKITFGEWLEGKVTEEEHWKSMLDALNLPISEEEFAASCGEQLRFFAAIDNSMLAYARELKDKGIIQAIASNNPKEIGQYLEEEYNLGSLFDSIAYSGALGVAKPDKAFFEKTCEMLGVPPQECIFIDDKEHNLAAAEELGMKTILFKDINQLKEEIEHEVNK